MVSYEGIFFENESKNTILSLEKKHLPIMNDELHCTFVYHPSYEDLYDELVGKEFDIKLIGYGCNDKNSGFLIEIPEELKKYYKNIDREENNVLKKPHITVSLTEDSKPYYTKDIDFIELKEPITVKGKFGYWMKNNDIEYLTYDKQNN